MTTLKDLLNDLMEEVLEKYEEHEMSGIEKSNGYTWQDRKDELLEEYINIIIERIIGYELR